MYPRLVYSAVFVLLLVFGATTAYGQVSATEILDNMRETHERGIQNIDDYTIVTDMYTAYYKKTYVDGRPTFKSRVQIRGLEQFGGSEEMASSTMMHTELFDDKVYNFLSQNAEYRGTETIDGHRTHVLFVPDLEPLAEDDEEDIAQNGYFYIDADLWILRQMKFDIKTEVDEGQMQEMQPVIRFLDYQNIEGLQIPFRTVMEFGQLDETISPEEMEEARQAMQEFERELEQMPEQQRKMMEQMMRPQMERFEKMLEGDTIEIVIEVEDVQVNTGLSEDMFN